MWLEHMTSSGAQARFIFLAWKTVLASLAAIQPEYPTIGTRTALRDRIADAGFALLGQRVLSDAAWEAYYTPMEARIAALRPGADADLAKVLDEADAEIALWRKYRHQFGYVLSVVRPE